MAKENIKTEVIKKILNIKYTPDFVGSNFIIECKGRANETFPIRWKLFKAVCTYHTRSEVTLYKPQNQKECDETINLILGNKKDLARRMYAKRKLQQFIDWSIESKGYLKYKDLIKYSEKYGEVDN